MVAESNVRYNCTIAVESRATLKVWSAALLQAKNESDRLVCANVYGLRGG